MRDRAGKIVGIIGAATDITEQQATQRQLSDDVSFRERMMGVLGHDLRNPLNAITLSGDLLLRRAGRSVEDRKQLEQIRRAADRMKEMIETLLDFTRLRFGAFPLVLPPGRPEIAAASSTRCAPESPIGGSSCVYATRSAASGIPTGCRKPSRTS